MARKPIIPKEEATEALLKFREKRKWQLAMRRYIIEKSPSEAYAPYFGLDIENFRRWIESQFDKELNWISFGSLWQFDHIIPVTYFDFEKEEELKLCWNFVNIRENGQLNKNRGNRIDVLAVKPYFQDLYNKTGYSLCLRMIEKINEVEVSNIESQPHLENFIIQNKEQLENIASLNNDEFNKLNKGFELKDILLEREILRKFG